jgi:hypothetical protein
MNFSIAQAGCWENNLFASPDGWLLSAAFLVTVVFVARFGGPVHLGLLAGATVWIALPMALGYGYAGDFIALLGVTLRITLPVCLACVAGGALRNGRGWGTIGLTGAVLAGFSYGVIASGIVADLWYDLS